MITLNAPVIPGPASSSIEVLIAFGTLFFLCVAAAIASRGVPTAPKGYSLGCWWMSFVCLVVMVLVYCTAGV